MGLLEDLLSVIGPSEAGAATLPRNPALERQRMELDRQEYQRRLAQQEQQAQLAQQREARMQQQGDARIQALQARAQPKPDPAMVIRAILGDQAGSRGGNQYFIEGDTSTPFDMSRANERVRGILAALSQGQAPQAGPNLPGMTATSLSPETGQDTGQTFALKGYGGQVGFNPQTGAFTNVGLPGQERAVSGAKPDQATGGGMESAGKRAVLAAQLKGKIPEAEITKLLDTQFPETKPNKGLEKDAAYIRSHAPNFYNKETGQPAGLDVIGQDLNPDEFRKTHIELNKTQQQNVDALGSLDSQINSYEALASTLGRSAEPGKINTLRNKLGTISGRLGGDPTVATLDASRAQITQIARAFGGDSRVSDREMQLLQNSVISDSDNLQAIQAKIGQLKRFREDKAKRMGLPWLMTGRAGEGDTQRKTLDQGTAAKFLNQAGGDKNRARELAKAAGYTF